MPIWTTSFLAAVLGYVLGAIPTGYLAGRLLKDIDIREHGSRSTGATNVLRTLGPWPALAVLIIDIAKGAAAILLALWFCRDMVDLPPATSGLTAAAVGPWIVCLAGLAALLGHGRSVWLKFTGGKSAATGLGVLLAMSWPVGLGAAVAFGVVLALSRIVSLSSMLAALTAVVVALVLGQPLAYQLLVLAGAAYVILRHRANIRRLFAGTEPRLGQPR